MYSVGDVVIYGMHGVCRVTAVGPLALKAGGSAPYYTLRPYYQPDLIIYAPADSEQVVVRPPVSAGEAEKIIDEMPDIPQLRIEDEKAREDTYRRILHGCDCRQLAGMIKALYARQTMRARQGRRATSVDGRYFRTAEEQLYGELAYVLGIPREDAPAYIQTRLGQTGTT